MSGLLARVGWRLRHMGLIARARFDEKDSDLFLLDEESTVPSSLEGRVEQHLRRKRLLRWVASTVVGLAVAAACAVAALQAYCQGGC